jgi:D-alanyl-D-alanine carboxypeptidase
MPKVLRLLRGGNERIRVPRAAVVASALVVLCHCSRPVPVRTSFPAAPLPYGSRLQAAVHLARRLAHGTGVSAAVIVEGEGRWSGASGSSDPDTPIRPDMLFDVASVGKNLLAVLVLQLAEEGRLALDDPVRKWLPDHPNVDGAIAIRQLLDHTSGAFDFVEHPRSPFRIPFDAIPFDEPSSAEATLRDLVGEPYFPPGQGWHYSTTNYVLLRLIVERATRSTVRRELHERFLGPLALDRTVILDADNTSLGPHAAARPWFDVDGDGALEDISGRGRAWMAGRSPAMVFSTAEDLARWSQALYTGRLLRSGSLEEMLRFHRPTPGEPYSGYGLGTGEFRIGGREVWGHLGWQYGYAAAMLFVPARSTSITVLVNDNNLSCIGLTFLGLWTIVEYESAKGAFLVGAAVTLLALSPLLVWPSGALLGAIRRWRRHEPPRAPGARRGPFFDRGRLAAVAFAPVFLAVSLLYLAHSANPEGPIAWAGGSSGVRAMLVLSAAGAVLSLLLLLASVRGWRRRGWSLAGRLHFTLVALASLAVVWSWHALGILGG